MKIFLDANILVSVLNKEFPLFSYSSRLLSLCGSKKYDIFTSPVCLAIAFYFAEKKNGNLLARKKIELLAEHISITETNQSTVSKTVRNKKIHDFEDGLEYYSAVHSGCKCIVTEDTGDFYFSEIEVLGTVEFFEKYVF
ncbi:MAG: PIN domain-containing protein [Bacteroidia bacterium]